MTMKKNLFLRLLLSAITAIPLISCRNDHFSEPETYNNSSQFQITSRVIPLQESKHKTKLLPELGKAQDNLKKFSPGLHGKTIDYGNGISINTDHVIYIENGPDYHTYTFKIDRADAPEDAPLENLVLSPLTDGTYRELLITYYLSPQEKEILTNGGTVDAKGKLSVMEIGTTAFNPLSSKSQDCQWVDNSFYTTCSEGLHSHGEQSPTCVAGVKSMLITDIQLQCQDVGDGSDGTGGYFGSGGGGGSGGSGGGSGGGTGTGTGNNGGTGSNTSPCPNGGILTGPQDITTDFGDGNCSGIPTQINLPRPDKTTPCDKTKAMLDRPNVQQGINNIKANAKQTLTDPNIGEIGFKEKKDGTVVPADVSSNHQVVYSNVTDGYGGYHNHTATGIHMFSPADIVDTLFGFAAAQSVNDGIGYAYFGVIAAESCSTCADGVKYLHYVIRYAGTGTELANFVYSPEQMTQIINDYRKIASDLSDPYISGTTYSNSLGDLNEKGLEKLFFDTLTNMGLNNKVVLQRIEPNGVVYNLTKDGTGVITATPCP